MKIRIERHKTRILTNITFLALCHSLPFYWNFDSGYADSFLLYNDSFYKQKNPKSEFQYGRTVSETEQYAEYAGGTGSRLASNQISVLQIGMAKELSKENGKDQYELSMARKWFQSSITPDELLTNAYMLSKNNRAFVSGNLVTTNEKEIYGTFYEVEGYSMEAWRESILRACKNYAFLPSAMTNSTFSPNMLGAKEPIIHMIVPISDYGIKSNQVMVYMLNTRRLFQDISPLQDGGLLCLRDKENNILAVRTEEGAILNGWNQTEEGEPDRENQESWIRIQSTNEITGLSADCYVPQEYFNELLRPAQRMTVFMAVGILLLVAILSFFMAARHSTSESRTMRMIEKIYPEIMDNATAGKRRKKYLAIMCWGPYACWMKSKKIITSGSKR